MKGDRVDVFLSIARPDGVLVRKVHAFTETASGGLVAVESNDEPNAPHGLRRLKRAALPKVGGLFGTAVAALTQTEADERLLRVLTGRRTDALREVRNVELAMRKLGWNP